MSNYRNIKIRKALNQAKGETLPYGVEIVIDGSDTDINAGMSEMAWYATKDEQSKAYNNARIEYGLDKIGFQQYYKGYNIETTKDGFVVVTEDADLGFFLNYADAEAEIDKQADVDEFEQLAKKYYYCEPLDCIYYVENGALMAIQGWQGIYDMDEAYEVWEYDQSIAEEEIEGKTLQQYWTEARAALGKPLPVSEA